jgi:hypothetical protein
LGRPGSRLARENHCVLPRIAYNAAVGVQSISRKANRAVHGGFLTWAAKPSVRESPNPARICVKQCCQLHLCVGCLHPLLRSCSTESSTVRIPRFRTLPIAHLMDDECAFPVARKRCARILNGAEQLRCVLPCWDDEVAEDRLLSPTQPNLRRRAGARLTRCWPDLFRTDRRAPSS